MSPDTEAELKRYDVRLVSKADSPLMRAVGWLMRPLSGSRFMEDFFTTVRFPWAAPRIYYPTTLRYAQLESYERTIKHELVHVRDFAPWWGPWWMALLFIGPLPVLLNGRWFIERNAYLIDILAAHQPHYAVEMLWNYYGWPWPRWWMRRWFLARLAEGECSEPH